MLAAGFGRGFAEGAAKKRELDQQREQLAFQKEYYSAQATEAKARAKKLDIETTLAQRQLRMQMQMMEQGLMEPEQALYTPKAPGLRENLMAGGGGSFEQSMREGTAALDDLRRTTVSPASTGGGLDTVPPGQTVPRHTPLQPVASPPQPPPETFTMAPQNPMQQLLASLSPEDRSAVQALAMAEGPGKAIEKILTLRNPAKTQHVVGNKIVDASGKVVYDGGPESEKIQNLDPANEVSLELFQVPYVRATQEQKATVMKRVKKDRIDIEGSKVAAGIESQRQAPLDLEASKYARLLPDGSMEKPDMNLSKRAAAQQGFVDVSRFDQEMDMISQATPLQQRLNRILAYTDALITSTGGPVQTIIQRGKLEIRSKLKDGAPTVIPDPSKPGRMLTVGEVASLYKDEVQAALEPYARIVNGVRGAATENDVLRSWAAFPHLDDTVGIAQSKGNEINRQVDQRVLSIKQHVFGSQAVTPSMGGAPSRERTTPPPATPKSAPSRSTDGEAQAASPRSLSTMTKQDQKLLSVFGDLDPHEVEAVMKGWGLGRSAEEISEQIRTHRADKGRKP